ncbi:helix-turn-helix domain-containing protein [Streptomyces gobiensis]|uniref:helix-turn-helix domain-containing protein n=1 Tax=Streptomyces gobiensis TaxID=2875706 RepID=UPI001E2A6FFC|nr:helix-turn-helix transcriptional regulator [Streptomyces gobiensis]UGY91240.1 helix-turn-helix domain-containing protein [Streptomyces gobiensis]
MAARRGATFQRILLGKELRTLREGRGLTAEGVSEELGFSRSKLTRVEKGDIPLPRLADLENLLDRYGITDPDDRKELLDLQRDSLSREPWTSYRHVMPSGMPYYLGLEREAVRLRAWQRNNVLGLLQTERYARALFNSARTAEERTTEFVERNVRIRMERKDLILREDSPVELQVVLDEAVLRRVRGDAEVMHDQYAEIKRLCSMDHVEVQIIPQNLSTYLAEENFTMLEFDNSLDPLVQIDGGSSMTVMSRDTDVWRYQRRFESLCKGALAPTETPRFLQELERELWT